ncbi:MAG: hypothetical protein ACJAYU_004316 [Bradymonadia bacterium]|jgi:hypothetical protein
MTEQKKSLHQFSLPIATGPPKPTSNERRPMEAH